VRVDLVEKVSTESKQRGGTVLTDLRTRDRSYWLGLDVDSLVERVRSLGELVEIALSRISGAFHAGLNWAGRNR